MDIQRALFAEIVANPNDDTPWLVLSDWYEDQQDTPRAELIRLSVRLRRPEAGPDGRARESRIRQLYAAGLTLPLPRHTLALRENLEMEMAFVPPGRFLMGSPPDEARRDSDEGPVHPVTISRGFWMGVHLVTQGQWQALLGNNVPGRRRGGLLPVEGISWLECEGFLERLARQHHRSFRLPTEAEWEYACRSFTATPFFFGRSLSSRQANFDGNYPYGSAAVGPWHEEPTPVGTFAPNGFGLFDMHGNVWEWCSDWFDEDYYEVSPEFNPPGPPRGSLRVLRGGSWYSYSWSCRSAGRERFAPESGAGNYGFRVVMDP